MSLLPHTVQQIDVKEAKAFIERWHYSGRAPTGKNIYFAWLVGDLIYAVADYGIGVNPYQSQSLSKKVGSAIESGQLLELKRLCRVEPKIESMPLTYFLARCHKILRRMGYQYIVSFSDPAYGHSGGIYKAANFRHLGKTNAENHCVDANGVVRHRRYYFRYARRNNVDVATARQQMGLTLQKTVPKDRWLIKIK